MARIFFKDQQRVEGASDSTRKKKIKSFDCTTTQIIVKKFLHKKENLTYS